MRKLPDRLWLRDVYFLKMRAVCCRLLKGQRLRFLVLELFIIIRAVLAQVVLLIQSMLSVFLML